jgi:predicted transcriptional regulator
MRKITISLSKELVAFADDRARALNTSRSQVIGMALSAVKTREEERLAADGYHFYAQEASEFADAASEAVTEAWTDAGS